MAYPKIASTRSLRTPTVLCGLPPKEAWPNSTGDEHKPLAILNCPVEECLLCKQIRTAHFGLEPAAAQRALLTASSKRLRNSRARLLTPLSLRNEATRSWRQSRV